MITAIQHACQVWRASLVRAGKELYITMLAGTGHFLGSGRVTGKPDVIPR